MNVLSGITSSGAKANKTGRNLEKFVYDALISCGYTLCGNHKKQLFEKRCSIVGKQFQEQVPTGTTIYKTKRNVDFLVLNKERFPKSLIIECKWQQSTGSVDEKYPYLIWNIIKTDIPTIVLLDGGGYKPGAKEWMKSVVNTERSLIGVWDMAEFQKKVNNGFLG